MHIFSLYHLSFGRSGPSIIFSNCHTFAFSNCHTLVFSLSCLCCKIRQRYVHCTEKVSGGEIVILRKEEEDGRGGGVAVDS